MAAREPTLVDARNLRPGEELRVEFVPWRAGTQLHMRHWYRAGNVWRPGAGLSVAAWFCPWLRASLEKAEGEALDRGLLDRAAYIRAGLPLPPELAA